MKLVRFDCGCMGLLLDCDDSAECCFYVIDRCDGERGELEIVERPALKDKSYEPMEREQAQVLLQRMGNLISDGYDLRTIRSIINR